MKMNEKEMRQESFNDRLDILRHVSDIKLRLKDDITNDFVLARLSDKDKEFIIEMTGNAYFSKKILDVMRKKGKKYIYVDGSYEFISLSDDEKRQIAEISRAMFDSYMIKIYMTVVLNRNVDKNYLINVLSGYREDEEMGIQPNKEEIGGYVKELLADQSKSKEK